MSLNDLGNSPGPATDQTAAPPRSEISPLVALILSMVVLPGLGQVLTGRKIRGVVMAGILALWLPAAIIKVGLDLNKVMPDLMARHADHGSLALADLQEIMSPLAGGLIWLFLPLAAIWLWALADSIVFLLGRKKLNRSG